MTSSPVRGRGDGTLVPLWSGTVPAAASPAMMSAAATTAEI